MDTLYAAAIAGDADARKKLEMEADRDVTDIEYTILHTESRKGNAEHVRFILREFANKNLLVKLSKYKKTALYIAAENGHTEVAEVLIDAARSLLSSSANNPVTSLQAFLRQADTYSNTALHAAVEGGYFNIVKLILEADPSHQHSQNDDGKTPIYIAAEEGYTEIVKLICTTCTAPSFQDFLRQGDHEDGNTALHIAVMQGNVAIVKLLLEADPSHRHHKNKEGKTPMYIAAEKGYNEIVKVFCTTCTAPPSLDGPGDSTALHAAILNIDQDLTWMMFNIAKRENIPEGEIAIHESFIKFLNKTDEYGRTILELAVERNHVDLIKYILVEDPAYQPGRGGKYIGLMPLIYKASDKDYRDIVMLLTKTYQAAARTTTARYKALVDIISAIKNRKREYVLLMVGKRGHDVTFVDNLGWTILHHAAYHQFDSVLGVIIEAGQNYKFQLDLEQEKLITPFHVAAEKGFTSTMILLLKLWPSSSSAYINVNMEGQNILHLAASQSKKKMIQGILEYCPQENLKEMMNKKDKHGNTPFHLLIQQGCFVPEFIKYKDLDMMTKNLKEWTPLDNFYITAEIVAEQAQIKIALDHIQTDTNWKFWRKNIKRENYMDSVVVPDDRAAKDAKFEIAKNELMDEQQGQMKKKLERYKKRTNTQIIVTALITTVTFTVGFTMPGGLYQSGAENQGLVIFPKKRAFKAFMVSDALALLFSTCSLFLYFLESMYEDPRQVSKLNAASTGLNIVSVVAMMLTFITGTYVVLSHSPGLAITVCVIGSLFFLFVIVLSIKMVCDRQVKRNEE